MNIRSQRIFEADKITNMYLIGYFFLSIAPKNTVDTSLIIHRLWRPICGISLSHEKCRVDEASKMSQKASRSSKFEYEIHNWFSCYWQTRLPG